MYGSIAEQQYHQRKPHLIPCHNKYLKHQGEDVIFIDARGQSFKAMADFYDKESKTIIEFKCDKLNKYKTLDDAMYAQGQVAKNKHLYTYKGWANSIHKHLIVKEIMNDYGYKYLVVFGKKTKLSKQQINTLNKSGLLWEIEE